MLGLRRPIGFRFDKSNNNKTSDNDSTMLFTFVKLLATPFLYWDTSVYNMLILCTHLPAIESLAGNR